MSSSPTQRHCTRTVEAEGFDQTLAKARRQLSELKARLARGKARKEKTKVEAEIAHILRPCWASQVVPASLSGEEPSGLRLTYRTDQRLWPGSKKSSLASGCWSPTKAKTSPLRPKLSPVTAPKKRPRAISAR